jgi:hypothetical protein
VPCHLAAVLQKARVVECQDQAVEVEKETPLDQCGLSVGKRTRGIKSSTKFESFELVVSRSLANPMNHETAPTTIAPTLPQEITILSEDPRWKSNHT